ncbi:hypothetical protein C8Q70DRAFT_1053765 [Cubamyces menziesii]|nr:hypothetical protein C8Q70DRAFT_1053765 [Cubamyces menziesii]
MPAEDDAERLAGALERLASTWVSYMLWPFAARDSAAQEFDDISNSGHATPNPADVVSRLDDGLSKHRREVAHIFKRAVARSDDGAEKASKRARKATFDILKHYCELDDSLLEELSQEAALLVLKTTETPHRYQFDFMPGFMGTKPVDTHHTFYGHSTELHQDAQSTSAPDHPPVDGPRASSEKRDQEEYASRVALPNPKLLRMHAALAHVTHASGAAAIFNALNSLSAPDEPAAVGADGGCFWRIVVEGDVARLDAAIEHIQRIRREGYWS